MLPIIIGKFTITEEVYNEYDLGSNIELDRDVVTIWVNPGDEGEYLPHFHIKSDTDYNVDCCIRIYQCGYFLHHNHDKPLSNNGTIALDNWLREYCTKEPYIKRYMTNWQVIADIWENHFGNKRKYRDTQPNYKKLNIEYFNRPILVKVDKDITADYDKKVNLLKSAIIENSIKLGRDKDDANNYCIVLNVSNNNSSELSCLLKHAWFNVDTGDTIYICVLKNNSKTPNIKDVLPIVRNVIRLNLFKIPDNPDKYAKMDFDKFSKNKKRRK